MITVQLDSYDRCGHWKSQGIQVVDTLEAAMKVWGAWVTTCARLGRLGRVVLIRNEEGEV